MDRFLQIHALTSFGPSNLNRDDTGRPKTAIIGGTSRLRISSQSLKRAVRTSEVYKDALDGHIGKRALRGSIAERVKSVLVDAKISEKEAIKWGEAIAQGFGSKKKNAALNELAFLSPDELAAVDALARKLAEEKRGPKDDELDILRKNTKAADIGMFGRMLADAADFNVDAAVQVAHAFTIHPVTVEDDYFTAVDDLQGRGETGAGHVNAAEFGSGVFYSYVCINRDLLQKNVEDSDIVQRSLRAFTEALLTVPPTGKQNSHASRGYASYALAERGSRQPRSLAIAFLDGIQAPYMTNGIKELRSQRDRLDAAYGPVANDNYEMDTHHGKGNLSELLDFVVG